MIGSVRKALAILNLFTPAQPALTEAQISVRLGLPRGTAHRLLFTLQTCGLVERDNAYRYALGPELVVLTRAVLVNVELRDRTASIVRELADECRQSVYLAVRDGDACLCIYAIESQQRLMARTAAGRHTPLHWTALGKAILACSTDDDVRATVCRTGLPAATRHTITDLDGLLLNLEQTRARGYAIENEEYEADTSSVGASVLDSAGRVAGSLAVCFPTTYLPVHRIGDLAARVMSAAQDASSCLGYVGQWAVFGALRRGGQA